MVVVVVVEWLSGCGGWRCLFAVKVREERRGEERRERGEIME